SSSAAAVAQFGHSLHWPVLAVYRSGMPPGLLLRPDSFPSPYTARHRGDQNPGKVPLLAGIRHVLHKTLYHHIADDADITLHLGQDIRRPGAGHWCRTQLAGHIADKHVAGVHIDDVAGRYLAEDLHALGEAHLHHPATDRAAQLLRGRIRYSDLHSLQM